MALALPLAVVAPELAPLGVAAGLFGGVFPDLAMYVGHRKTLHCLVYYSVFAVVAVVVGVGISLLVLVLLLYYFLVDGRRLVSWIGDVAPTQTELRKDLLDEIDGVTWAVLKSHTFVALVEVRSRRSPTTLPKKGPTRSSAVTVVDRNGRVDGDRRRIHLSVSPWSRPVCAQWTGTSTERHTAVHPRNVRAAVAFDARRSVDPFHSLPQASMGRRHGTIGSALGRRSWEG
jgi:hypothetical protein